MIRLFVISIVWLKDMLGDPTGIFPLKVCINFNARTTNEILQYNEGILDVINMVNEFHRWVWKVPPQKLK